MRGRNGKGHRAPRRAGWFPLRPAPQGCLPWRCGLPMIRNRSGHSYLAGASLRASIRKARSSWVVIGLLALLVAAFIITSVQDPFSLGGGARIAKVGSQSISTNEFVQQFDRIFRQEQRERPEI